MDYFTPNREWEIGGITNTCNYISFSNQYSTYIHCYLQYEINVVRFSSMYYSSVVIPAIGMIHFIQYLLNELYNYFFNVNIFIFSNIIDENFFIFNGS